MSWIFQPLLAAAAKLRNLEPTVVLNSPANGGVTADTTPDLTFTGTDPESNDIRYQVQIATDNLFTNYSDIIKSSMTSMAARLSGGNPTVSTAITDENAIIAVVTGQDSNTNSIPCAGVSRNGQNFTKIAEYGGSGGTGQPCNISIWYLVNPNTGTYDTVADCSETINECTVTVYRLKNCNTSSLVNGYTGGSTSGTPPSMSVTTDQDGCYLIGGLVSETTISGVGGGQDSDSSLTDQSFENTRCSSKAGGTAGSQSLSFSGGSAAYAQMMVAINRINTGSIVADKVSGTDAGFSGSPDNSDPFASAQAVTYTVQSALNTNTTYYWRVRGKDPSGSNAYGAWSSTRSFIIAVAKNLTDTGAGSDSISVSTGGGPTPINITDSGSGADVISIRAILLQTDSGAGVDVISAKAFLTLTDSGSGSDTLTLKAFIALADSGLGADSFLILAKAPITDTGTGVETLSLKAFLTLLDSATGSDLIALLARLTLTDVGTGSETLTVAIRILQSDTGAGADVLAIKAFLTLSDTATGLDALSILARMSLSDTGTGADIAVVKALLAQIDAGTGGDTVIVVPRVPILDAGAGTDSMGIKAFITLLETAVGADSMSILARLQILDIGTGVETITPRPRLTITDAGSAVDALTLASRINITDFATGAEALQIAAYLQMLDSGVANDLISILNRLAVVDNASGSDQLAIAKQLLIMESGVGTDAISFLTAILLSDNGVAVENVVKLWVRIYSRITGKYDRIAGKFTRLSSPYSATRKYSKQSTPYTPKN